MIGIKFRAWDGNKMVYNIGIIPGLRSPVFPIEANFEIMLMKCQIIDIDFDKYPAMQFTGLSDKNGKQIYEGDIVKLDDEILLVEFCEEYARFGGIIYFQHGIESENSVWRWGDEICDGEIIGNEFENPELIKSI